MVFVHFPSQLTEEEEMLQKKYQKLRRKRKALQQLKAPKQEPPISKPMQSNVEAKPDAKEVAKKLLKSGAISALKVENKERQGFKRPKALERKRCATERMGSGVSGYHPFSSSGHGSEDEAHNTSGTSSNSSPKPVIKKVFESFVSSRDVELERKEERIRERRERDRHNVKEQRPRQGNTVYVRGFGVTQQILEKTLKSVGRIINISMEMDKNCGFVTFESMMDAETAIKTMNGVTTDGVNLSISLARKQPVITPNDDSPATAWGPLAANFRQKGTQELENRNLVSYDDLI